MQQEDIDRRLKAITGSDSSDDAAKRFEASIEKLRRLEISRGYMTVLKEAEELRWGNSFKLPSVLQLLKLHTASKP